MLHSLESLDPNLLKGLREHVHEKLRQAIIVGRLPTGTLLNERKVAAELGVSTTPLKEALRRLEHEGLVRTEPRRGIRVTFDAGQAEEMALARAALESMIARLAAARITDDALATIRGITEGMKKATQSGAVSRLIELNEAFHDAIHAASGCHYLKRLLVGQLIYDKTARRFLLSDVDERGRALVEHLAIFAALEARDEDGAERAMRDHIVRSGKQHVQTAFERR
ncbi:GntR family transcriptional regulator [Hyphomicrobiales bacterium]|nr:GntR family transcriptional regulator [Hyphomicrobiales bacterium]CAH1673034.1 GntR family transcriptional regulator [Hyphomicrobiales bacterium]